MKYIYVTNSIKVSSDNFLIEKATYGQVDSCLYSLIGGLKQKDFGLDTINKFAYNLKKHQEQFCDGITQYADSGGYSIIVGDVEPNDIERFIQCYMTFFEYEDDLYDQIFSLDIPFSLKHEEMNRKDLIYEYNKNVLSQQLEVIECKPHLLSKLFFVWHFKMKSLYQIWTRLVSDLNLNKIIQNRAIGGMVSLRRLTNIDFSPFTGIAFRCFHDYLNAGNYDNGFRLHFLGINLPYDRFHIAFLEKLFGKLSNGHQIFHTYDSIEYAQTARLKKDLEIYDFTDDYKLEIYNGFDQIPDELIKKVYSDENVQSYIFAEIKRRKSGQLLNNINSFIALNIYSNLCVDRFFEYLIDKYEMVDMLVNANSTAVVEGNFKLVNSELKRIYPNLFKKELMINIIENMEYTWTYCNWFKNDRSDVLLDYHNNQFIECIGCSELLF